MAIQTERFAIRHSSWSLVRFIIAVTGDEMRKEKKILGDMYIRMSHILEFIRTNVPRSNSVGHNILMDVAGLASQSHADVQIGERSKTTLLQVPGTWWNTAGRSLLVSSAIRAGF
jgi:phosphopantetheine adenylyltransferase